VCYSDVAGRDDPGGCVVARRAQRKKSRPKKNRRGRPVRNPEPRLDRHPLPDPELRPDDPIPRIPSETIRARNGVKVLRHGLRLGWRLSDGREYPVIVTRARATS